MSNISFLSLKTESS